VYYKCVGIGMNVVLILVYVYECAYNMKVVLESEVFEYGFSFVRFVR